MAENTAIKFLKDIKDNNGKSYITEDALSGYAKKNEVPTVSFKSELEEGDGTLVGTLTINSTSTAIYAPAGGGSGDGNADTIQETFSVELGTNGTIGGYKTGDVIEGGTNIEAILKKLFRKATPVIYDKPTISLTTDTGSSDAGSYEYGSRISVKLKAIFTKNDAGNLSSISISENGVTISSSTNFDDPSAEENSLSSNNKTINSLTSTLTYKATASYAAGTVVKENNLGEPITDGMITAGSVSTTDDKAIKFTPYRCGYFYGVLATDSSTALTSAIIRTAATTANGGGKKSGAYAAGNLPVIKASSVANRKRIFVACPKDYTGVTKVIMPSAMDADCTKDFIKQDTTVSINGANESSGIEYNVWVYEPASISDDQTFTVTLG